MFLVAGDEGVGADLRCVEALAVGAGCRRREPGEASILEYRSYRATGEVLNDERSVCPKRSSSRK